MAMLPVAFRALTEDDLPQLHRWLSTPHVVAWWEPAVSLAEVCADYLPRLAADDIGVLDADAGVVQYVASDEHGDFGYIQAYRVMAHQKDGWWPDETDPHAVGIDQFIGVAERLDKGLGTRMVRDFCAFLLRDPRVQRIQTDPDPQNMRAIAAYRKAGFVDVGHVTTLDGPALLMHRLR
jgi:RimJ/RimL family protein N-acetyltransferase